MTWHIKNQHDDGVMTHPSHGEAWKSFDCIHSDFALDPRNIRLGLCSDGFTPNIQFSKPYSCWPVIVIPYNLPPGMCIKDPYLFLTCLIPGPNNPKANIDVLLGPLIDELNELWNPGVLTYDIVEKKNFVLKAALMWTINDFPAYGMLSGWMTQGRLSCPICMEDTKSFTLSHGGKASWFDCHRRFLPINHPYRRNKNDFRKNKIESEEAPTRLSGLEIWQRVKGLGKISDNGKWIKLREYEKNVFDNIMNTVMDTDRTKDNEKARLDLAELCKRPDLHLRHVGDNCWSKPKAAYTLTSEQQQDVYRWVQQLRFLDGYASNLARCSLTELSQFFKDLCSTTLKVHDLEVMEQNIPIILCKLERIFLPGFFNVMEHLPIHLAYEARMYGPVQYRWMYPFERVIGAFKRTMKNRARVEGSICEDFLAKETSSFVSFYFEPHILSRRTRVGRNDDDGDKIKASLLIFNRSGRKVGKAKDHWLDERDKAAAYLHILLNESKVQNQCNEIVDPGLQSLSWGPSNKATSYPIYKVNGYTFHTLARAKGKKTDNTGVFVKGDIGNGESDWFGVLEDILELEYTGSDSNQVVLFKCQWYDPSRPNGTRIHNDYKITEVNHSKRYRHYDHFIVAQKAKQVYFLPYPGNCKSMWRVVVNTKPRGRIEINHVHVEEDEEENDVAYQADESNPSRISDTEPPISLKSPFGEDRIVELSIGSSSRVNKNEYDDVADFDDDIDF
ncbi:uncharacterized protein [Arachis hypogaea]|uniref:uncharacterized protein n=1 Tax=Arachis hypogaea TaxID=3818 RepID=UPI000DECB126|nr:uncharacterized protein LOC112763862 [Arachis hypogaea]